MKEKINKTIEKLLVLIEERAESKMTSHDLPALVEATAVLINVSNSIRK